MTKYLKAQRIGILVVAGLFLCHLSKSQWIEVDPRYENLHPGNRFGYIDTSGNTILSDEYLFLGISEGCEKMVAQEYIIDGLPYWEYNDADTMDYVLVSMDGVIEKLPVRQITYIGDGWFIARKDSLWGIIDCNHNWIIEPVYENQLGASGNYIFFQSQMPDPDTWGDEWEDEWEDDWDGYWIPNQGVIDFSGDTIIPPEYYSIDILDWWDEPYFIVEKITDSTGLFNMSGKEVIPIGDHLIFPSITDESVWVVGKEDTSVYYPGSDKWVTENLEELTAGLFGFESGLMLYVSHNTWEEYSYGYWADKDNIIDIPADPESVKPSFENPYLIYSSENGYYGIVSRNGDTIVPFICEEILLNEDQGYFNHTFAAFCEGTVPVRVGSNWALVDTTGTFLTHLFYTNLGRLKDGLAPAEINGKWGYIDKTGRKVVPFIYDWTQELEFGLGEVWVRESIGLINASGRVVSRNWGDDEDPGNYPEDRGLSPIEESIYYIMEEFETADEVDYLDLDFSRYTRFPEEFYQFPNVTEMYIYGYGLPAIKIKPHGFEKLRWLSFLDCQLETIPDGLLFLPNLETLELSGGKINKLPSDLFYHPELDWVLLDGNNIRELPENIPVQGALDYLSLAENQIKYIPSSIANLKSLDDLNLSGNLISTLPPELANLKRLAYIDFSYNQFTEIPKEIAGLKKIGSLVFSYNQISSIPAWISEIKSLKGLYLENNNITRMPDEILKMKKLEILNLKGNPIPETELERIRSIRPDLVIFDE